MTKASWTLRKKTRKDMFSYIFWTAIAGAFIGVLVWGGGILTSRHPSHGDFMVQMLIWLILLIALIISFAIVGAIVGYKDWRHDSPAVWIRECLEPPEQASAALETVLSERNIRYRKNPMASELATYDPHKCDWAVAIGEKGIILKVAFSPDSTTSKVYLGPQTRESELQVEGLKGLVDEALGVN